MANRDVIRFVIESWRSAGCRWRTYCHVLDETRDWQISEENFDPNTGQSVVTLNAPLRGIPMLWPHLPYPNLIMEESLMDTHGRCVIVALAKKMEQPEDVIEGALEEIFGELYDRTEEPWCNKRFTEVGVTPKMLIRFAEKNDMGCIALHGNIAYHRSLSDNRRRTLVLSWWSGHCFLYTSAREFQGFKVYDIAKPEPQSCPTLQGTIPCKTPAIEDWQDGSEEGTLLRGARPYPGPARLVPPQRPVSEHEAAGDDE